MRSRALRGGLARACSLIVAAGAFVACGPDGPDAYVASPEETPATRPVPTPAPDLDAPTSTPESVPANGEVVQVRSLDNTFRVADIEVVAGTEVLWTNNGRNDHDVLPVDDTQEWGVSEQDFAPGDEYRHVFSVPGVYLYYCSIHGTEAAGMIGSVTVVPPS